MSTFLWRRVTPEEQEKIREEAKHIMHEFGKSIDEISEGLEELSVKREEHIREEKRAATEVSFRKIFFENAPHEKDFVKAEKGAWK